MSKEGVRLYTVNTNVKCINCGKIGAIQIYGTWYPNGIGKEADEFSDTFIGKAMKKYRDEPYMDYALGFGGTMPHQCLNCGSVGLIDIERLESYNKAFESL